MNFFSVIGRLCFALVFLYGGVNKILNWNEAEQSLIHGMLDVMQNVQGILWTQQLLDFLLPHSSELLLAGTVAELLGGALIFLGLSMRLGALILALFLIPTTLIFHHFWWVIGADKELQLLMFLKNLALFGACLVFLSQKGKPAKSKSKRD
ncbi:MAG TPA: DoxX family protein [Rhabdochlamydiaceae bacterium]|nr:DoxX family protein [Rhabdochlamydiaceae bacterium]